MDTEPAKKFSWTAAILLFLIVGLLTAGLSVFVQARTRVIVPSSPVASSPLAADLKPAAATTTTSSTAPMGLGSSFEVPGKPVRLIIPAIGVDAAVQSVGLAWAAANKGDMSVPSNFTDVAWYNGGPLPGMPGSAVIDGHLDGKYVQKAVFYNLGALKPGDLVEVVDASGTILQFQVVTSTTYDYNATTTDIFSRDASKTRLNLITCAGDWDANQKIYNKRIVVFTELVNP
jgi:LPXTG-site transpeptidase (sortase) family protein